MALSVERLREVLDYEMSTGVFTWRITLSQRACIGKVAGCSDKDGYIVIRIDGTLHKAHRLAWLHVYGTLPSANIDHINLIPSDNRIENLRLASWVQNSGNRKKTKRNTTGYKGVSRHRDRFIATIQHEGKWRYLGIFSTADEAAYTYQEAAKRLYREFANW